MTNRETSELATSFRPTDYTDEQLVDLARHWLPPQIGFELGLRVSNLKRRADDDRGYAQRNARRLGTLIARLQEETIGSRKTVSADAVRAAISEARS